MPLEALVERALDALPEEFARLLADVAIVIEEVPTPDSRGSGVHLLTSGSTGSRGGAGHRVGFGLRGTAQQVSLFQLPLETDYPDPDELAEQVRVTVIHELAHHAGIDDDRLHELGLG